MNGLEEIKNPISCTFNKTTGVKKYEYTEAQVNAIEKELGVDLVKLLNAKKVYYMGWDRNAESLEIKETYQLFINLTKRTIEYFENEYSEFIFGLELKNYGKNNVYGGWALTKEELEK